MSLVGRKAPEFKAQAVIKDKIHGGFSLSDFIASGIGSWFISIKLSSCRTTSRTDSSNFAQFTSLL